MNNETLKSLAEEIANRTMKYWTTEKGEPIYGIHGFIVQQAVEALERVQKESLAAQLPKHEEIQAMMSEFFTRNNRNPDAWEMIYWLRDNIRLAPVERVSDVELRDLATNATQQHSGERNPVPYGAVVGFELGYRIAEKKAHVTINPAIKDTINND